MGCLVKSYFSLDTTALPFVPEPISVAVIPDNIYALARFPAGSEATLPRFTRQS
jgi:hypothetical protein